MDSCSNVESNVANVAARTKHNRFAEYIGVRITKIAQDYAEGELPIREELLNPMGLVHGGCLCTLADTVAGCAAATRGRVGVTLDCRMDYLHPARDTAVVRCVANPQRVGRTIMVYRVYLTDDKGEAVAAGTFTFFIKNEPLPDYIAESAAELAAVQAAGFLPK
ncbi:PaaI family thioesterase [Pseudoflavonifractor phocaeensis]|uniref:PaaI family thioesterase n=1 Tax=Pseudoflavonifractor phocaeensis TaxID=1870988 RepID=UPI00195C5122|nr:PaaI family thioesterase [Pseudoflavonifractor phocaeensis]MBM6938159.1 PaaI family thioesterase [Pseudoflavonifractor phocaeensis]